MTRMLDAFDRAISGAVLLREAARTSRQWQTYAARTAFSGVLIGVLLLGIWAAVNATQTAMFDAANLGWLGRGLFIAFAVTQMCLAVVLAPLSTASAIVEETDEGTLDLLVLTRLAPGQILGAKVASRILVLLTVVCGALPVMAMVVNLGGVSTVEVVAVTVHTLVTVVIMGSLGAFFALFTRSPMLATMASASFTVPFFLLLPMAYVICTGDPYDAAHFSTLAAPSARDWSALLPALSYLPTLALVFAVATPLFQLKVSNADFRDAFSDDIWHTGLWARALGVWVLVAVLTLPLAAPGAWALQYATSPFVGAWVDRVLHVGAVGWIWLLFVAGAAIAAWAFLRIGMDVVDGIDGMFTRPEIRRDRKPAQVGPNPVWWREARPRAWLSSGAPIFITWMLVLLAVFQTGWWIFPGGLIAVGSLNTAAALLLTGWLASSSIAEERRRQSLEVLLVTTIPAWKVVLGKAGGAALPTLPLMLISLPLLVLGVPHLHMLDVDDLSGTRTMQLALRGLAAWVWLLPVWALVVSGSMVVALRAKRSGASFGMVAVALAGGLGLPAVLGRIFPDQAWVAVPARILAPPLAGGESWWQLALSTVLLSALALVLAMTLTRNLRRWGGVALAAMCFAMLPTRPALAQPSDEEIVAMERLYRLRMRVVPLADGLTRQDRWTSLTVVLENAGPATVGELSWEERSDEATVRFTRPVELPEGAKKEVEILVRVGRSARERVLDLGTREGRKATAVVRLQALADDQVGLAVIGRDPLGLPGAIQETWAGPVPSGTFRETADDSRRVRTGLVPESTLPSQSAGWSALDQVVWPAADPSGLSEAQVRALTSWVADGGHLLLTVSDTWRQVEGSPLAEILPVHLTGVRDADVEPLALALGWAPAGEAPIATVEARDGREAWVRARSAQGDPLWISAPWGTGTVHLVTADLRTAPLDQLDRREAFRRLLHLPAPDGRAPELPDALAAALHLEPETQWQDFQDWEFDEASLAQEARIRQRLSAIPGVAPLPMSWLVAFGSVYLLVIGPGDFFLLRWLRRQPLTWLTFPASIAVFGAIALIGTSYTKGSQAVLTRVERIDLLPAAGLMRGDTWLGVFSTRKTHLELRSGFDDSVLEPLRVPGFMTLPTATAGAGAGHLGYDAETWTLAYAHSRWSSPLQSGVDARRDADGSIRVTSHLPFDLDDCGVLVGGGGRDVAGWIRLGHLPSGGGVTLPSQPDGMPLPTVDDEGDDLAWAVRTFHAPVPGGRGSLRTAGRPLTWVGVARRSVEPVSLTGLAPIDKPLLVMRMPLPEQLSVESDLSVGGIVVSLDTDLQTWSVELTCGALTRTRNQPAPEVRFDGLSTDALCAVRVGAEEGWASIDVPVGGHVRCARTVDGGLSCAREEP